MRVWGPKNFEASQDDVGQNAVGVVQLSGLGLSISVGMFDRLKNHVLIPSAFHNIAYTPPPLLAKPEPYEDVDGSWTEHPSLLFVPLKQSVEIRVPVSIEVELELSGCVQPSVVWSV